MGVILTTFPADGNAVRDKIGITTADLSDTQLQTAGYLGAAEAYITGKVDAMAATTAGASPTVAQIMAATSPAVAADKVFLQAAVIDYIAFQFTAGATNAVDTAISVGPISKDLGGIGAQWKEQGQTWLREAHLYLTKITGWKRWRTL